MPYIDGFVIPIARKNLPAYWRIARKAAKIWREYGCLEYRECLGDDLANPWGVPFPKLANVKKDETVVFSWITYRNKAHRDSVNKKIMKDPRLLAMCGPENSPFDPKRMAYGGFKVMVAAGK